MKEPSKDLHASEGQAEDCAQLIPVKEHLKYRPVEKLYT